MAPVDPSAVAARLVLGIGMNATAPAPGDAPVAPIHREATGPSEVAAPPDMEMVEPATAAAPAVAAPVVATEPTPAKVEPAAPAKPANRYAKWEKRFGGYGELDLGLTTMDDAFATLVGGGAGFIVLNRLIVGASGYGVVYHDKNYPSVDGDRRMRAAWGGPSLGVYAVRTPVIESSATWLLAGGRACLNFTSDDVVCEESTDLFVSQLEIDVYVKIANIVRLGVGLGYRFVGAADWQGPGNWDLAGGYGSFKIAVGRFDPALPSPNVRRKTKKKR